MIRIGCPQQLGAVADATGTRFAVYASQATRVELCLFNAAGRPTGHHDLPDCTDGIWHGYLPGCRPGQLYGYRVHGAWDPQQGLRHNPAKLLLDPYARMVYGEFVAAPPVFDGVTFEAGTLSGTLDPQDSAPYVPKSVVTGPAPARRNGHLRLPWVDLILYEAHVGGFTMTHPALGPAERGRIRGLRHEQVLAYLRALGITAIELMPLQGFIDEVALQQRGLRNYWGYNTVAYFAPAPRYLGDDGPESLTATVDALHEAGIEVIMDIAFNHTGESDEVGPTLCFRGLDNLAYYRTIDGEPGRYINDTGCGNTLDCSRPIVQRLVMDCLAYWHRDIGIDGFRFDLATVLGRDIGGFSPDHPLLQSLDACPELRHAKLIAEPWDVGPGGYALGRFPARWAEWNDRYRDGVRRFWRGEQGISGELAARVHGSADIFEASGRAPTASINFVTSHDGFTLQDLVSYTRRHNKANGENNRDGHHENFSCNHGVEGATDSPAVIAARRRHRLNLLATLLFSQGTPMLLAGDEFGNTQHGNNNAYAQDNPVGWLDWSGLDVDPTFTAAVRKLIALRRRMPLLRLPEYRHGNSVAANGWADIAWLRPDGRAMSPDDWPACQSFTWLLPHVGASIATTAAAAVVFNQSADAVACQLPLDESALSWQLEFSSDPATRVCGDRAGRIHVAANAIALLCLY